MLRRSRSAVLAATAFAALFAPSWSAKADDVSLIVRGAGISKTLSLEDIRKLPSQKIHATPEHRAAADYDCTAVATVLASTGASPEKSLRGKRLSDYLLVKASDGYQAVFALPEIDPEFNDRPLWLCYLANGAPMPAEEGPLRLIVPGEKRGARWVRNVNELSVERLP